MIVTPDEHITLIKDEYEYGNLNKVSDFNKIFN